MCCQAGSLALVPAVEGVVGFTAGLGVTGFPVLIVRPAVSRLHLPGSAGRVDGRLSIIQTHSRTKTK